MQVLHDKVEGCANKKTGVRQGNASSFPTPRSLRGVEMKAAQDDTRVLESHCRLYETISRNPWPCAARIRCLCFRADTHTHAHLLYSLTVNAAQEKLQGRRMKSTNISIMHKPLCLVLQPDYHGPAKSPLFPCDVRNTTMPDKSNHAHTQKKKNG